MKSADEMTGDELARAVIAALKTAVKSGVGGEQARHFVEQYSAIRMSPNQIETAASYMEHCIAQDIFLTSRQYRVKEDHE